MSKELEDGLDVMDCWVGRIAFPVGNRGFVNADLVRSLLLEKLEVEAASADVVA